ncbi:hypothetical protein FDECE_18249 [Fusarium decemcellulare]|nr:hypothetical protein FDECE_18249 [Fusarium decemcellulare]
MPGIPRSKRCQRCKQRRTKCDEKWPCCTPCRLANVACSGPPTTMKFVHNGHHGVTPTSTEDLAENPQRSETTPARQWTSMVHVSSRTGPNGGPSYGLMRLVPHPRSAPTTSADRVSARWVAQFEKDAIKDLLKTVGYTTLLPRRVAESPALRDVLALFCSTWLNFKRGKAAEGQLIDLNVYAKAIRSLRRAIEEPAQSSSCETLAATMLLERFEVHFDAGRSYHRCVHGRGVYSILAHKGPPKLTDELDVCLALESQSVVQNHCVATGDENFYDAPHWQSFLAQALESPAMTYEQRQAYKMEGLTRRWPLFCQKLHEISQNRGAHDLAEKVLALRDEISASVAETRAFGEEVLAELRERGSVTEVEDPTFITGSSYDFHALFSLRCFGGYFGWVALLNRILFEINKLLGEKDPALDTEYKHACRHLWMCFPFVQTVGPLAEVTFCAGLIVTYEGGNEREKAWLLDVTRAMDKYRKRLPTEDKALESYILHTARIITGRCYLPPLTSSLRHVPLRELPPDSVMRLCEENSLL